MGRPRKYVNGAARVRAYRARKAAERVHQIGGGPVAISTVDHEDPVGALAEWSRHTLRVPPGHPRAGDPMVLPPFAVAWLRASWDAHESALSTARKNAKSAIAAVVCLGYLCGPLRRPGWRGAIASLDKGKAGELRRQCKEIAEASGLDVKIRRSPYPGVIESSTGSLDTLSADRTAAVAYWSETGALRTWLAFGDVPDLAARGRRDGADYLAMARRGELRTYHGRTVPISEFVLQVETDLGGADVRTAVADGYKASELLDVCPWPLEVVRSGVGPSGSQAVRAFQRAILTRTLATVKNYSLTNAIAESTLRRDGNGNPAINQARSGGRIDVLSAAVLAVGEAALCPTPVPMVVYTLTPAVASA